MKREKNEASSMNREDLAYVHVGADLEPTPPSLTKMRRAFPSIPTLDCLIRVLRGQYSVAITTQPTPPPPNPATRNPSAISSLPSFSLPPKNLNPISLIFYIPIHFPEKHTIIYTDCLADFMKFMAQKTEKEDAEFKVVPETIVLCAKCGVACNNPCQKCFSASSAVSTELINHVYDEKPFRSSSPVKFPPETDSNPAERSGDPKVEASAPPVKREVNRCSGCRRKVGLTGFRCRCGDLFCADHRYSDRHDCSYGYKATGREAIARENPVVKAAKLVKI